MFQRFLFALAIVGFMGTPAARAGLITVHRTISDTQPLIDIPSVPNANLPAVLPFAIFDFSGQPTLSDLTGIEITLTMEDGDTGAGQFDFNQISLGLDDVPTGIALNGFSTGELNTLTFSLQAGDPGWLSAGAIQDLLTNLYSDNQLFGLLLDATPEDNCVNLYSAFDTTLKLTGTAQVVPEPASWLIWGLIVGAATWRVVRQQRQSAAG